MKRPPRSVASLLQREVESKPSALHLLASKPIRRWEMIRYEHLLAKAVDDARAYAVSAPEVEPSRASLFAALRSVLTLVDRHAYMTAEQQLALWQAMEVAR